MRHAAAKLQGHAVDDAHALHASPGLEAYRRFLEAKVPMAGSLGLAANDNDPCPVLREHAKAIVKWAVRGGRRAIFASFGLGKTSIQLETLRTILAKLAAERDAAVARGAAWYPVRALIVAPLGVRQEFMRDLRMLATGDHPLITDEQRDALDAWQMVHAEAARLGMRLTFIRRIEEAEGDGLYITNYETVRDGKLDPKAFDAASLDEASVLRGFGGTKTFREFMRLFEGIRYKFVATATPSPNQYIELLAYAAFLEVMDVGQAKTRFFKRNSEKADELTIHPHKEREFWLWVASWGLFVQKPSDLDFSDAGYDLPPIRINWHELPSDHAGAGVEKSGQGRLLKNAAASLSDAAREKRESLETRVAKMRALLDARPGEHCLLWHDLEAERFAIEAAVPEAVSVYGTQELDARERAIIDFSDGKFPYLAAKPVIAGSGCNFQRHCAWAIFVGVGFKFNDFIQALHRIYRFMQTHEVTIDILYTEAERPVRDVLEAKWHRHDEQMAIMSAIIREYGLAAAAMAETLTRSMGVERVEITGGLSAPRSGEDANRSGDPWLYRLVNNDCVDELARMDADSVDLVVTSIPFSTQYEYSPNYADFGHTDDDRHFWQQMDHMIPNLLRVVKPGRVVCVHVKDRIIPGSMTGLGFQTVSPFSDDCVMAFRRHGFAFLSRVTIGTDVVRENNQTYRLGWSEQCKDGSRMGNGLPEYLLKFRKPQTERATGYADVPVVKGKRIWNGDAGAWEDIPVQGSGLAAPGSGYSRARWQLDANGIHRSSGDRLLTPGEVAGLDANVIYKLWRANVSSAIYDYDAHVRLVEGLEERGSLPKTFALCPVHATHPEIWTDVARMLSMNTLQASAGRELHLCPLPFDIVDRAIVQHSMEGETVLDPFGGVMTVPFRALKHGRRGIGIELSPRYFADGSIYVEREAQRLATPSLFGLMGIEDGEPDLEALRLSEGEDA